MRKGALKRLLLMLTISVLGGVLLTSCTVVSTVGAIGYTAGTLESRTSVSSLVRDNTQPSYADFTYEIFSAIPSGSSVYVAPVRIETNDGHTGSRYDDRAKGIVSSYFNYMHYGTIVDDLDEADYIALISAKETMSSYKQTLSHVDLKLIDSTDQAIIFHSSVITKSKEDPGFYNQFSTPARGTEDLSYAGLNKILQDGVSHILY